MRLNLLLAIGVMFLTIGCMVTIEAQGLPVTLHAEWSPNPATDQVVSYTMTLDAGAPQTILASACTATTCTSPSFTINDQTSHTVSLVANAAFASSPPATATFQVKVPGGAGNIIIKKG